jgi:hypothetical protein
MQHPLVGVISAERQAVFPNGTANSIACKIINPFRAGWQRFLDSPRFGFIICPRFAATKRNSIYFL